jgi:hypothetical protein
MSKDIKDIVSDVEKGAALLDGVYDNWAEVIEIDSLEMDRPDCCVLAQLYGSYFQGIRALDKYLDECSDSDFGFDITVDNEGKSDWSDWDILQGEWEDQIAYRMGVFQ